MPTACPAAAARDRREAGASLLEYVLLVALVAAMGAGALAYLGRSNANFTRAGSAVSVGASDQPGAPGSPGPPGSTSWCTSGRSGCSDTVVSGSGQVISFTASGGTAPYHYSLRGNPTFVNLSDLDPATGKGEIVVSPPTCAQAQDYGAVTLVVTGSGLPAGRGVLSFSLSVSRAPGC